MAAVVMPLSQVILIVLPKSAAILCAAFSTPDLNWIPFKRFIVSLLNVGADEVSGDIGSLDRLDGGSRLARLAVSNRCSPCLIDT